MRQVGGSNELLFDGRSCVLNADGHLIARAHAWQEDLLVLDLPQDASQTVDPELIRPQPEHPLEELRLALTTGLRDYVHKSGFSSVVLGLSGGIDSALVATIAAQALGPEQVLGVALPSRYSSEHSLTDAEDLARNLGVRYEVIPIDGLYTAALDALAPLFAGTTPDTTEENLQARARGDLLMALSNKFGHLLLTTGNKSEVAVGYCTLYGDMCGSLAVIADLPKTMVFRLARYLNEHTGRILIPESTLTKPPSAELRPGQLDQDSLPPYELLDEILHRHLIDGLGQRELLDAGLDEAAVRRVLKLLSSSEYKRVQAAPGLRVSRRAFGSGRRVPSVASHRALLR